MYFPSAAMRAKKSHVTVSAVTLYRTESIIFTTRLWSFSSRNARGESNEFAAYSRKYPLINDKKTYRQYAYDIKMKYMQTRILCTK